MLHPSDAPCTQPQDASEVGVVLAGEAAWPPFEHQRVAHQHICSQRPASFAT